MYPVNGQAFRLTVLLCLAALPVGAVQGFYIAPHLNNITQDGVTLIWETGEAVVGAVEYGTDTQYGHQAEASEAGTIHRVRVTGLAPETLYHYRVRAGEEQLESTFKTAPATERPITFVVIGDSRRWNGRWEATKMNEHAAAWDPEFYLNMGDLVNNGHQYELWAEHFERFTGLTDRLMMVTGRGNHEGSMKRDLENDWFAKYHELPGDGEPFATFDWGNTHFVVVSYEQIADTAEFLDQHLPKVKKPYTVVLQHYPVYCTGYYAPDDKRKATGEASMERLAEALDRFDVDIDIAGHTHIYERLHAIRKGQRDDRNGTTYVVNGGDIEANFPDWFSAVTDDRLTQDQPTYTVFHMGADRAWFRTFCWSRGEERIIEIDYHVDWKDEAVPKAELAKLPSAEGDALAEVITELGAMGYHPAAEQLLPYLAQENGAIRRAAAKAIRSIGVETVSRELIPYVKDGDFVVRREVARALEIAMDADLAVPVSEAAVDPNQDARTRVSLIGALQFHAPPALATQQAIALLRAGGTPPQVRERAAYALARTATPEDVPAIVELFKAEQEEYVTIRLGFALNALCGRRQPLDSKSPIGRSKPGAERDKFIDKWLNALKKAA